ncbi:armadillo-type protein [Pisolithus croceorrhizus]|nr:armadillo-type protein [Pisolithus croceorrhizus]
MEGLLDFSREFDVSLLDRVAVAFYTGAGQEQQMAQQVLTQFEEHPDAWTRYIGLQILERLITTRWRTLPDGQRQGIRNFVVASDEATMRKEKTYLNKLNLGPAILKQEWPHNWPTFITELVESSKTNLSLCENNMAILRLLSEEVFDYSAEQMTQTKIKNLKNQMCGEFSEIFKLLIRATLETLLRFLNWIPLGYIFETTIIDLLLNRFLEAPDFRNVTLKCLAEIAGLNVGPEYDPKFVILFAMVMTSVNRMIPPSTNIAAAYATTSDAGQELVLNLALFLSNRDVLLNAHLYMVKISQVEEREIFKIPLEYWSKLVAELYDEMQSLPIGDSGLLMGLSLGNWHDVLSNLRLVVIERMVKPEEVLIVENDEGEIVREFMKESDTIVLYKQMRELLVYLTHLDVSTVRSGAGRTLNTLCWAIGSISGAMNEETEKRFLVTDIMYIVGQYPRFLKAHWKFLKTVVNKLFEFMHETHEGVQDMACDTFIKIAQKCRRHFVMQQSGEQEPFIDEILAAYYTESLSTSHHNNLWDSLMAQAAQNMDVLSNLDNMKILSNVLKTNCFGMHIYWELLPTSNWSHIPRHAGPCIKPVSGIISETVAREGTIATKTPKIRQLRTVKKEILKPVNTNFMPPLLDAILGDYNRNEVLNVMATITARLGPLLTPQVPAVLDAVFEPTLNMINQDFAEFPEHRVGFFKLLRAINLNCFPALLTIPPAQFKLFMDSIIWAYQTYLTGYCGYWDHKSGFKLQSLVLARLFQLVETNQIQSPLFDPAQFSEPGVTNSIFLKQYCANLLKTAFPHMHNSQIQVFVTGLGEFHSDINRFKLALRDFLIQLKEFSSGDNAELFLEEKEAEAQKKAQEERELAMRIPGMLKPSQLEDKDEDIS